MKHFVCHGSLRQINQSWSPLIRDIWRWLALSESYLHSHATSSLKLHKVWKRHTKQYPFTHMPSMSQSMFKDKKVCIYVESNIVNPYSEYQYSWSRSSENIVKDQCTQPQALRCSINAFTQPFKSVGGDRFGVIQCMDDGWVLWLEWWVWITQQQSIHWLFCWKKTVLLEIAQAPKCQKFTCE